ncbi:MAG TPA: alpha/beta fold hydrolase [Chloroflexota bacterium]
MATFVLVHGAWHGGWCWQRVASRLRTAGHEVYTPTLTGLGERVHLVHPGIDLQTHITDVVNLMHYEDLRDVVLVGHSYAGMVVTGVADRVADRVAHLVFLDAFLPQPGQSLHDILGPEMAGGQRAAADAEGDGWRVPPLVPIFGIEGAADLAWATPKFTAQPLGTLTQGVQYRTPLEAQPFTRTYIQAAGRDNGVFGPIAERLRGEPTWRVHVVDTGHDVMITRPAELTELLLDEVATPAGATR